MLVVSFTNSSTNFWLYIHKFLKWSFVNCKICFTSVDYICKKFKNYPNFSLISFQSVLTLLSCINLKGIWWSVYVGFIFFLIGFGWIGAKLPLYAFTSVNKIVAQVCLEMRTTSHHLLFLVRFFSQRYWCSSTQYWRLLNWKLSFFGLELNFVLLGFLVGGTHVKRVVSLRCYCLRNQGWFINFYFLFYL